MICNCISVYSSSDSEEDWHTTQTNDWAESLQRPPGISVTVTPLGGNTEQQPLSIHCL